MSGLPPLPALRLANDADAARIADLMRASVLALFPAYYDERQTASAARYVAHLDPQLIADRTYYAFEVDGDVVACGGWSRRGLLYMGSGSVAEDADRLLDPQTEPAHIRAMFVRDDWTRRGLGKQILEASRDAARAEGFTTLDLMATLPGVPLYRAFGFIEIEHVEITMPDGVTLAGVTMQRPVDG